MIDGLRYANISAPDQFGVLLVCYPPPQRGSDVWGVLAPLRETSWGPEIPTVTGEALSHALHGYVKPLLEMLGRPPQARALRIPLKDRLCLEHQQNICANANRDCCPGSTRMPECYVPPTEDRGLAAVARAVAAAWDEGRYVFVVEGEEFIVR